MSLPPTTGLAPVIGLDLGTTNCSLAWAEPDAEGGARIQPVPILQLTHPGTVEPLPTTPSSLYLPGEHELPPGSLRLPWQERPTRVVGALARDQGAKVPDRLVASAKSWLCHETADRRGPILPWGAPPEVPRLSPVEASAEYLAHLRAAWDHLHPDLPMASLDLVLTVPASFDAAARELTVEAARLAGLTRLTLLEEPLAAFYAWLDRAGEGWREQVSVGDRILVCDLGGGTTDFTLIEVTERGGDLSLERVAVGEHLLLGGDNMDLALAYAVRQRLKAEGRRLDAWQLQALTHACRQAKERLLGDPTLEACPITLAGRGSSLLGGALRTELRRGELEQILVEGFFPRCERAEGAARGRRAGLTEGGLPFESEPAITRHLARFLSLHRAPDAPEGHTFAHPTALLFNGGVLRSALLRERIAAVLDGWLAAEGAPPARILDGDDLELAVSRGAARYGVVRQGRGIRVRGGTSRAYYVGVEAARPAIPGLPPALKAVCVAPFGMEEGSAAALEQREFGLVVGEPVEFRFLGSTSRKTDRVGDSLEDWEDELEDVARLGLTLEGAGQPGAIVPVRLESKVTEVGTLELWCVARDGSGRWKLELEVRERPQG